MNRSATLALLVPILGAVYTANGKLTTDSPTGFGPALDSAFRLYLLANDLPTTTLDYDVPAADIYCFGKLAEVLAYDLVLPYVAATAADSFSVDAPLTTIRTGNVYKNMRTARNDAWSIASACGYMSYGDNVGSVKINTDYREPGPVCLSGNDY